MADLVVVDDDEDVSEVVEQMLSLDGHDVRVGKNGVEGLQLLSARLPDAVLIDVEMPELDGPSMVVEMVRKDRGMESVPIVLMSGAAHLEALADRIGTPYVARKPCDLDVLLAIVHRAVTEHRPPRAGAAGAS
jgi:DNA-binding NtrC family response regulator